MPKRCVVLGCSNTCKTGHSLHRFPPDPSQRAAWTLFVLEERLDFSDPKPHSEASICEAHFSPACYNSVKNSIYQEMGIAYAKALLPGSVPTIQAPGTQVTQQEPVIVTPNGGASVARLSEGVIAAESGSEPQSMAFTRPPAKPAVKVCASVDVQTESVNTARKGTQCSNLKPYVRSKGVNTCPRAAMVDAETQCLYPWPVTVDTDTQCMDEDIAPPPPVNIYRFSRAGRATTIIPPYLLPADEEGGRDEDYKPSELSVEEASDSEEEITMDEVSEEELSQGQGACFGEASEGQDARPQPEELSMEEEKCEELSMEEEKCEELSMEEGKCEELSTEEEKSEVEDGGMEKSSEEDARPDAEQQQTPTKSVMAVTASTILIAPLEDEGEEEQPGLEAIHPHSEEGLPHTEEGTPHVEEIAPNLEEATPHTEDVDLEITGDNIRYGSDCPAIGSSVIKVEPDDVGYSVAIPLVGSSVPQQQQHTVSLTPSIPVTTITPSSGVRGLVPVSAGVYRVPSSHGLTQTITINQAKSPAATNRPSQMILIPTGVPSQTMGLQHVAPMSGSMQLVPIHPKKSQAVVAPQAQPKSPRDHVIYTGLHDKVVPPNMNKGIISFSAEKPDELAVGRLETIINPKFGVSGMVFNSRTVSGSGRVKYNKDYLCNLCKHMSDSYSSFSSHFKSSHMFNCDYCSFKAFSRYAVVIHTKKTHPQAIDDLKGYEMFEDLDKNPVTVTAASPITSSLLGSGGAASGSATTGRIIVQSPATTRTTPGSSYFTYKIIQGSAGTPKKYECDLCHYLTASVSAMYEHAATHSMSDITKGNQTIHELLDDADKTPVTTVSSIPTLLSSVNVTSGLVTVPVVGQGAGKLIVQTGASTKTTPTSSLSSLGGSYFTYKIVHSNTGAPKKYECDLCQYQTLNISLMYEHASTHSMSDIAKGNQTTTIWECFYCNYRSHQQGEVVKHVSAAHPSKHIQLKRYTNNSVLKTVATTLTTTKAAISTATTTVDIPNIPLLSAIKNQANTVTTTAVTSLISSVSASGSISSVTSDADQEAPSASGEVGDSQTTEISPDKKEAVVAEDDLAMWGCYYCEFEDQDRHNVVAHVKTDHTGRKIVITRRRLQKDKGTTKGEESKAVNKPEDGRKRYEHLISTLKKSNKKDRKWISQLVKQRRSTGSESVHEEEDGGRRSSSELSALPNLMNVNNGAQDPLGGNDPEMPVLEPMTSAHQSPRKGRKTGKNTTKKGKESKQTSRKAQVVILDTTPEDLNVDVSQLYVFNRSTQEAQCNICDKKYTGKMAYGHMREHLMIHTGERIWACPYCEYRCNRRSAMYVHVKTIHSSEPIKLIRRKPYQVQPSVINYDYLQTMELSHEEDRRVRGPRSHRERVYSQHALHVWECLYCTRRSVFKGFIKIHMKTTHPDCDVEVEPKLFQRPLGEHASQSVSDMKQAELCLHHLKDMKKYSVLNEILYDQGRGLSLELDMDDPVESVAETLQSMEESNSKAASKLKHAKYQCPHCNMRGIRPSKVKVHIMTVHPDKELYIHDLRIRRTQKDNHFLYVCRDPDCKFMTMMKQALYAHVAKNPTHINPDMETADEGVDTSNIELAFPPELPNLPEFQSSRAASLRRRADKSDSKTLQTTPDKKDSTKLHSQESPHKSEDFKEETPKNAQSEETHEEIEEEKLDEPENPDDIMEKEESNLEESVDSASLSPRSPRSGKLLSRSKKSGAKSKKLGTKLRKLELEYPTQTPIDPIFDSVISEKNSVSNESPSIPPPETTETDPEPTKPETPEAVWPEFILSEKAKMEAEHKKRLEETADPSPESEPVRKKPRQISEPLQKKPREISETVQKKPREISEPVQKKPRQISEPVQKKPCEISEPVEKKPNEISEPEAAWPDFIPSKVKKKTARKKRGKTPLPANHREGVTLSGVTMLCRYCHMKPVSNHELMKEHLTLEHSDQVPVAVDVRQRELRKMARVHFCPMENCRFVTYFVEAFAIHLIEVHEDIYFPFKHMIKADLDVVAEFSTAGSEAKEEPDKPTNKDMDSTKHGEDTTDIKQEEPLGDDPVDTKVEEDSPEELYDPYNWLTQETDDPPKKSPTKRRYKDSSDEEPEWKPNNRNPRRKSGRGRRGVPSKRSRGAERSRGSSRQRSPRQARDDEPIGSLPDRPDTWGSSSAPDAEPMETETETRVATPDPSPERGPVASPVSSTAESLISKLSKDAATAQSEVIVDYPSAHSTGKVRFKCVLCTKTIQTLAEMKCHILDLHVSKVNFCLDMHARHMRKKQTVFICMNRQCKFCCKTWPFLRNHIRENHMDEYSETDLQIADSMVESSPFLRKSSTRPNRAPKVLTGPKSIDSDTYSGAGSPQPSNPLPEEKVESTKKTGLKHKGKSKKHKKWTFLEAEEDNSDESPLKIPEENFEEMQISPVAPGEKRSRKSRPRKIVRPPTVKKVTEDVLQRKDLFSFNFEETSEESPQKDEDKPEEEINSEVEEETEDKNKESISDSETEIETELGENQESGSDSEKEQIIDKEDDNVSKDNEDESKDSEAETGCGESQDEECRDGATMDKMYQCSNCTYLSTDKTNIQAHLSKEHKTSEPEYTEIGAEFDLNGRVNMSVGEHQTDAELLDQSNQENTSVSDTPEEKPRDPTKSDSESPGKESAGKIEPLKIPLSKLKESPKKSDSKKRTHKEPESDDETKEPKRTKPDEESSEESSSSSSSEDSGDESEDSAASARAVSDVASATSSSEEEDSKSSADSDS